jgi:[ribosomal protein S5]-alanine N-acetyltransferase
MPLQLVMLDHSMQQALAHDPACAEALGRDDWPAYAAAVTRIVGPLVAAVSEHKADVHWDGYVAIDRDSHTIVGSCAFKAPPTDDGTVEIAYFTYPGFEGRGYATRMAEQLVTLASQSPEVRHIIAHTLPEANASTRILTKIGMRFVGDVVDPHDGPVWRWEREPLVRDVA